MLHLSLIFMLLICYREDFRQLVSVCKDCPESKILIKIPILSKYTPLPNQKENVKTMPWSNFDSEAFGDMYSTLHYTIKFEFRPIPSSEIY